MKPDAASDATYAGVVREFLARQGLDRVARTADARREALADIKRYLSDRDQPDARRTAHIAGTDGKGSTAIMLESILRAAGAHTLLETSPHLEQLTERIRIAGVPIAQEQFSRLARVLLDDPRCANWSFFDLVTVLGWLVAAEQRCDWQVLEVGLGGRLDTTNVVARKDVALITSIDLEHTAILGDTIAKIAAEKAAIITHACDVVTGASLHPDAVERVEFQAASVGARVHSVAKECEIRLLSQSAYEQTFELRTPVRTYSVALPMLGAHQAENAAAAVRAAELTLGERLGEAFVRAGLKTARNPGRFEVFEASPTVVLDAMHTVQAAQRFRQTVERSGTSTRRAIVFAALADKRLPELVYELAALDAPIYVAPVKTDRTAEPEAMAKVFAAHGARTSTATSIESALAAASAVVGPDGVVFVVGGVYTVAEARALLR